MDNLTKRYPAVPFIAPFVTFILLLALKSNVPLDLKWHYLVTVFVVAVVIFLFSWPVIRVPPTRPLLSVFIGGLVFVLWIGPDLISSDYRHHSLFENSVMGLARSSLPVRLQTDPVFLAIRILGTALLVPIIEELFWRGWLMRYLINPDFRKIPLGAFSATSFWLTAVLFASEHGPFWDVGLVTGIVYNWWVLRTRNLADCMIAHGVTNLCLAIYVITRGQWQYWL